MKRCEACGFQNTDDSNFCENCGKALSEAAPSQPYVPQQAPMPQQAPTPQQAPMPQQAPTPQQASETPYPDPPQKKGNSKLIIIILAAIVGTIALCALLFLLLRGNIPGLRKDPADDAALRQEETSANESNAAAKSPQAAEAGSPESQKAEDPSSDDQKLELESQDDHTDEELQSQEDYGHSDMNGVDNAYIQVVGTIAAQGDQALLSLPQPSSICAYGTEGQIVYHDGIAELFLSGEIDLEEHIGDEVSIKGKLSADASEHMVLQIVSMDVTKEAAPDPTDSDHRYTLILDDATWEEAAAHCASMGGYLVQIDSEEEFQSIIQLIEDENMQGIHFYLGGRRNPDSQEYYWVDSSGAFTGPMLNPEGTSWAAAHWMENEPSFSSEGDDELYMVLNYYQNQWVLNDVPIDITPYYPGKTGYICEFEES